MQLVAYLFICHVYYVSKEAKATDVLAIIYKVNNKVINIIIINKDCIINIIIIKINKTLPTNHIIHYTTKLSV